MSFHTPWYVIIPTIVISYYKGIVSYPHMSFHTVKVLIHTCTCHCILVLFHINTCHFIPATICFIRIRNVSYVQILFHTFENLFHTVGIVSYAHMIFPVIKPTCIVSYPLRCFFVVLVICTSPKDDGKKGWESSNLKEKDLHTGR